MGEVTVDMERIVDHIEHVIQLGGDDFVGFGSDFDGVPALPEGIDGCGDFPDLLEIMRQRAFTEQSILKICHGNFLRVLGG